MRLIDADAFLKRNEVYADCEFIHPMYQNTLREIVDDAPTIDAVPVVRCGECKFNYANMIHDPLDDTDYTDITCTYWMSDGVHPNDYCSKGARMDGKE